MRFIEAVGQFELCMLPSGQYVITEQMEDHEFLPFGTTEQDAIGVLSRRAIMKDFCAEVVEEIGPTGRYALEHTRYLNA